MRKVIQPHEADLRALEVRLRPVGERADEGHARGQVVEQDQQHKRGEQQQIRRAVLDERARDAPQQPVGGGNAQERQERGQHGEDGREPAQQRRRIAQRRVVDERGSVERVEKIAQAGDVNRIAQRRHAAGRVAEPRGENLPPGQIHRVQVALLRADEDQRAVPARADGRRHVARDDIRPLGNEHVHFVVKDGAGAVRAEGEMRRALRGLDRLHRDLLVADLRGGEDRFLPGRAAAIRRGC